VNASGFSLEHPLFKDRTGQGVTVAVIDSGVHAANPHITAPVSGINLTGETEDTDFVDRLGHGTAVSAAILEKAPRADLFAIRVFDRTLATSSAMLARAIERAADEGCRLINLSLGTRSAEREDLLRTAVGYAVQNNAIVVSAYELDRMRWLPGSLAGVAGVLLVGDCPRDDIRLEPVNATQVFRASGFPRPISGVPPERNLQGISFAVANVTGMLARLLEGQPDLRSSADVFELLSEGRSW
jgi:hypothetical protein